MIITPRAHNPTGCSLSESRARAIREILARYPQVLVIVDDHFALLSATPWYSPIAAESQRWALVRSLSKTLGPDMRLAIVASDADTSAALRLRLNSGSQWVSHLLQDLVIACLNDDAFMASLTESRRHYRRQHEKLIAALAYPVVLAFVAVGVVAALMIFVVPRVVEQFDDVGQQLPFLAAGKRRTVAV